QQGISQALKQGKKPAKYVKLIQRPQLLLIDELNRISISEGKGKSPDTRNAYKLYIGRLSKFLKAIEQENMLLDDFSEDSAQEFKEYLIEEMELKNVTVNCTIQPLKQFLEILFVRKQIPINPFYNVKYLPKHRGSTFIAFTEEEKQLIHDHLSAHHQDLYLFSLFIYTCFIRPKELCALRVADIDLQQDWITVRGESSKVHHTSHRQLMEGIKQEIIRQGILK